MAAQVGAGVHVIDCRVVFCLRGEAMVEFFLNRVLLVVERERRGIQERDRDEMLCSRDREGDAQREDEEGVSGNEGGQRRPWGLKKQAIIIGAGRWGRQRVASPQNPNSKWPSRGSPVMDLGGRPGRFRASGRTPDFPPERCRGTF